jgi:hypothetical protein
VVSIRENWTDVVGKVQAVRPSARGSGTIEVDVKVESAEPVPGFADFLSDRVGSVLRVAVGATPALAETLTPGAEVRMRIRRGRTPEDLFAHTRHLQIESR